MSLAEEDLEQIRRLIREEVQAQSAPGQGWVRYDLELREDMNRHFEQVDKRFEQLTTRIDRFMRWSFALTLTVGGLVVAAIKYLP